MYFFLFRLTAMEFLSGFRSNCSFYYLDRGLYFSVLPRRRCQEFTYSELVSVHSYSFLSLPFGSFTVSAFLTSKGAEFNTMIWFHMPTAWWTLCCSYTTSLSSSWKSNICHLSKCNTTLYKIGGSILKKEIKKPLF